MHNTKFKFNKGDKVLVVNNDVQYPNFVEFYEKNTNTVYFPPFVKGKEVVEEEMYEVLFSNHYDDHVIVGITDGNNTYLIGETGLFKPTKDIIISTPNYMPRLTWLKQRTIVLKNTMAKNLLNFTALDLELVNEYNQLLKEVEKCQL